MSNFLTSSIGKKIFMSITGLFLIMFLFVHLGLNLLLLVGEETFNQAAHFMATNPVMHIMEPVLAAGFIVHIIYATILTLQNQNARPVGYERTSQGSNCSWSSRNMYILGGLVLVFLGLHIMHFFYYIKFDKMQDLQVVYDGVKMDNAYALVTSLLELPLYAILYVAGAILLGLHMSHGFWSAFQTIGWSNDVWRKRLNVVGGLIALIFGLGFSIIPLYFLIHANFCA